HRDASGIAPRPAGGTREQVLGVVEPSALQPARAGHAARVEHALIGARGAHAGVLPDRRPEVLQTLDRPAPQRLVVGVRGAAAPPGPGRKARHLGAVTLLF